MAQNNQLVDLSAARTFIEVNWPNDPLLRQIAFNLIDQMPRVDAVELPKGKPGDYLEWDNGAGFKQIYHIHSVMICEDCMRYDIEICSPVVNHPAIVRILSLEEAEKEWKEMCAKAALREEPTFTACAKMDGDGNA